MGSLTFAQILKLIIDQLLSTFLSNIIPRQLHGHIISLVRFQQAAAWGLLQTCKCILNLYGGKDADILNERDNVRSLNIDFKFACGFSYHYVNNFKERVYSSALWGATWSYRYLYLAIGGRS
jgi:hypothetical protein